VSKKIKKGSEVVYNATDDDGKPDENAEFNGQTGIILMLNSKHRPVRRHKLQFQTNRGKRWIHAKLGDIALAS